MTRRLGNLRFYFGCALAAAVLVAMVAPAAAQNAKNDPALKGLMGANGLFQRGLLPLAAEEYVKFLEKYPNHAEASTARYGLSVCYYRLNQYPEAAKQLAVLVQDKAFKQRDEALAVLGHCQLSAQQYPPALATYTDLLTNHADSKHAELAALNRAQVLYLLNRPKESLAACKEFLAKYPASKRRGPAEYFMACSQLALNDSAGASAALQKFLAANTSSPYALDATLLYGQSLENQRKYAPAVEQYRAFIAAAPEARKGEGHYSAGLSQYKAGQYAAAATDLAVVVQKYAASEYAAPARLQLGLALLAAGKPAEARQTLVNVVGTDKARAGKAAYWLTQCAMAEGKFAEARKALTALASAEKAPANIDAIVYDRAVCAMETGQYKEAAAEFEAFATKYSKSPQAGEAVYRQAFCLHKLGQYPASQALCEAIIKQPASPITAAAQELAAENLFLLNKPAEAGKIFAPRVGSATGARKLRLQFRLGQCLFLGGDYKGAVAHLRPVATDATTAQDPTLREAAFFLGDAQFQLKQYPQAAKSLAGYIASGGTRKQEAAFKLGLAQTRAKQSAAAEKTLGELIAGPAGSQWVTRAMLAYGQLAYRDLKQPDKAAEVLTKLLDPATKAPDDLVLPATYLLAWIAFDAKRYDAAAGRFGQVVAKNATHPLAEDAAIQQAVCARESGRNKEAIALLEAFVKNYPASSRLAEARHMMGTSLAETGQNAKAIEALQALADNKKTCTDSVLYELAWAYRSSKKQGKAIANYQALLKRFPRSKLIAPARTELAELLYLSKDYSQAATLVAKVVSDTKVEAKTRAVAMYRLGWCYLELKESAKAAKVFADVVAAYPDDKLTPSAMYQAGVAATLAGDLAAAETSFTGLLEKYPDHDVVPVTRLKLGELQATAEMWDKSIATYQDFLAKHDGNEFAYLAKFGIGWAMENQKKYDPARQWFKKVIDSHSGETAAKAQFHIGECYFAEGRFKEAAPELLKVDIVYAYPEWSSKALYEAGRAFEQTRQVDQAKEQYKLCVTKYKDTGGAALAQKRLDALAAPSP